MDLLTVYYTQSFVIGLVILAIVYLNFRVICDKRQHSHVVFLFMMLSVAINLTVEYTFYMLNGKPGPVSQRIRHLFIANRERWFDKQA